MTSVTLINPNLVLQKSDMLTTGIVYMPIGLASFAGALQKAGRNVQVIDAFGEQPNQWREVGPFIFRGLTPKETVDRINDSPQTIFFYAINVTYHRSLLEIIQEARKRFPFVPIVVLENTQAVTAYSIRTVENEFYSAGADYIVTGEAEERGIKLLEALSGENAEEATSAIDGIGFKKGESVHYTPPQKEIADLDQLAFPAWELFPLRNYWSLKYGHGPFTSHRYLPLLTSRGCPYPCRFCVIPETNNKKWRARSAAHVVDEIEHHQKKFGVSEFHWEDVNPTVNDTRTKEICEEIIRRNLRITWKICAGTKVETMKTEETIDLMARAGCNYISISPESGSARVMKMINKPFNVEHAKKLIHKMNQVNIRSQACFVLGFPGEEDADRQQSLDLARQLTVLGIDEIAVFIITPVPGSEIFPQFSGYTNYSELTFSPTWRQDYALLNRWRLRLYRTFLWTKFSHHFLKFITQPFNFLFRHFQTKMEMAPYRALHTWLLYWGITGEKKEYL